MNTRMTSSRIKMVQYSRLMIVKDLRLVYNRLALRQWHFFKQLRQKFNDSSLIETFCFLVLIRFLDREQWRRKMNHTQMSLQSMAHI